jgi:hypothetical protein
LALTFDGEMKALHQTEQKSIKKAQEQAPTKVSARSLPL